ncbi:MAG: V-type ATPase subunit [Spirochaetes bacterium]|nr:V-type ATPase subunit [Spirochaetota bacterium]
MADSSEIAYLYARICGAFSNMNLAGKGADLARDATIASLWELYFHSELPNKPEPWLYAELERKVIAKSIYEFVERASPFIESNAFVQALVSKYEYSIVKWMLYVLASSKPKPEELSFSNPLIDRIVANWPRLEDMFGGTVYSWINPEALADLGAAQNRLDRQYYAALWDKTSSLPSKWKGGILSLLLKEMTLQNLIWALRLRRYYGYSKEQVLPLLITIKGRDVTGMAIRSFELDIDNIEAAASWPERWLLAGQRGRQLDLPALEVRVLGEMFSMMRKALHLFPGGYTPLYCYFKFLDTELSTVLGIIEGLRLKVPSEEKEQLAWAFAGESA